MAQLREKGVLDQVVHLTKVGEGGALERDLSVPIFYEVVGLLAQAAARSDAVAGAVLGAGVSTSVRRLLESCGALGAPPNGATGVMQTAQQVSAVLGLVDRLLPALPPPADLLRTGGVGKGLDGKGKGSARGATAERLKLFEGSEAGARCVADLFTALVRAHERSVFPGVQATCISILAKLALIAPAALLGEVLPDAPDVAKLLTSELSSSADPGHRVGDKPPLDAAAAGLVLIEALMRKARPLVAKPFLKEGVVHSVAALAARHAAAGEGGGGGEAMEDDGEDAKEGEEEDEEEDEEEEGGARTAGPGWVAAYAAQVHAEWLGPLQAAQDLQGIHGPARALTALGQRLLAPAGRARKANAAKAKDEPTELLRQIFATLAAPEDPVSAYQLLESGLIASLAAFLAAEGVGDDRALARHLAFLDAAEYEAGAHLPRLVTKLSEILGFLERFPVHALSGPAVGAAGASAAGPSGLGCLARPLKLKLVRGAGEAGLKDFAGHVVLVEPLATVSAVERFLLSRVVRFEPKPGPGPKGKAPGPPKQQPPAGAKGKQAAEEAQLMDVDEPGSEEEHDEDEDDEDEDEMDMDEEEIIEGEEADLLDGAAEEPEPEPEAADTPAGRGAGKAQAKGKQPAGTGRGLGGPGPRRYVDTFLRQAPRLALSRQGAALPRHTTILEAVLQGVALGPGAKGRPAATPRQVWDRVHELQYRALPAGGAKDGAPSKDAAAPGAAPAACQLATSREDLARFVKATRAQARALAALADGSDGDGDRAKLREVLQLLALCKGAVELQDLLPETSVAALVRSKDYNLGFRSGALTRKFTHQLRDALVLCSNNLPAWCTELVRGCPVLIPFELRRRYFQFYAFGLQRGLQLLQDGGGAGGGDPPPGLAPVPSQRQKVKVDRGAVLDCALKIMRLQVWAKDTLEIEYEGEEGSGLGPTLEFYSLLSREIAQAKHGLWRHTQGDGGVKASAGADRAEVYSPGGLFPAPRSPAEQAAPGAQQQLQVFQVLGHFAGRALRDGRLLDLEFSEVFWKVALGRHVGLADLHAIDGALAQSLSALLASEVDASGTRALNGVPVADLALDFTLPGCPGYELCAGGADTPVDGANVEAYVRAVLHATFVEGVRAQMQAFRQGVNKIFPLERLEVFTESEISQLLCGQRTVEPWTVDYLKKHVTLDHGYDSASAPVQYLFEVLSEFDKDERRQFLQFITGAPTLPYGGLAALRPKLTVVCKYPSGASPGSGAAPGQAPDLNADLPSVMTCANYFKLPPFTSKATMAERIKVAMTEGAGSFTLS